jgi:hypothetical protein
LLLSFPAIVHIVRRAETILSLQSSRKDLGTNEMIFIVEVSRVGDRHVKSHINANHIMALTNPSPAAKESGANAVIKLSDGTSWEVKEYAKEILEQIPNMWDYILK